MASYTGTGRSETPGDGFSEHAAPIAAALPAGVQDPLIHEEWDPFWKEVESYFQPIKEPDVDLIKNLNAKATSLEDHDPSLRIPRLNSVHRGSDWDTASVSSDEKDSSQATGTKKPRKKKGNTHGDDGKEGDAAKDDRDDLYQRLNSYPFTHRLLAALVDEGGGVSMSIASAKGKGSNVEDPLWIGPGEEGNLRTFQRALEERVSTELKSLGLIEVEEEDSLQAELRQAQWVLRDLKMMNKARRESLMSKVLKTGLKNQARARELKKGNDEFEILYLERMIRKCKKNKRMKSKYQKVLNNLFPDYKLQKKDLDDAKDDEPPPSAHKSVKKKSYNKRPQISSKAAAKKKGVKSDDEASYPKGMDLDDDPSMFLS